jgi:two-component sensor histidine kinase
LVNLADYIGTLCSTLMRGALADRSIQVCLDTDEIWMEAHEAWRVGLILSELVRNAVRHGLAGRPGAVALRLVAQAGRVECFGGGNGESDKAVRAGRGMRIINGLAAELGGAVEWWFEPSGCLARLTVQGPQAASA